MWCTVVTMKTFHHFTSVLHWPHIAEAGFLKVVESNVDMFRQHAGPDVVWLLDTPTPSWGDNEQEHGLSVSKRRIRFDVEIPFAIKWVDWEFTQRMEPEWRETFVRIAGGPEVAEHWYIVPAPISKRRWAQVVDTQGNEVIWSKENAA